MSNSSPGIKKLKCCTCTKLTKFGFYPIRVCDFNHFRSGYQPSWERCYSYTAVTKQALPQQTPTRQSTVMALSKLNLFVCQFYDTRVVSPTIQSSAVIHVNGYAFIRGIVTRSFGIKTVCNFNGCLWRPSTVSHLSKIHRARQWFTAVAEKAHRNKTEIFGDFTIRLRWLHAIV